MTNFELYSLLFTDIFVNNLVFIPGATFVFDTMKTFGAYNKLIILCTVTFGIMFSSCINYVAGIMCKSIVINQYNSTLESRYNNFTYCYTKYQYIILLLTVIPFFGTFIQLGAGFCRIRLIKLLSICTFAHFILYTYLLLF